MNTQPKKSSIILAIVIGISLAILFAGLSYRNDFITMEESINSSWAQVENVLQRRSDLIPNLVNTVKGYAKHEQGVINNIAEARAKLAGARTQSDKIAAANQFEGSLARLLVVVEQYPNLKANEQFNSLMTELAGSENRVAVERKKYNEQVQLYNTNLRRFPRNLVASLLGFNKKDYFKVTEKAKEVPSVNFN